MLQKLHRNKEDVCISKCDTWHVQRLGECRCHVGKVLVAGCGHTGAPGWKLDRLVGSARVSHLDRQKDQLHILCIEDI